MTPRLLAICVLLAATALAGCGRMGELERPGPRGPVDGRADVDAAPREEGEMIANTPDRMDARDRAANPAPPRTLPIEGQGSDPFAVSPQGVLPDPYANPQ